jgi:oxygen-dependent protoporphyrinogen oxidase
MTPTTTEPSTASTPGDAKAAPARTSLPERPARRRPRPFALAALALALAGALAALLAPAARAQGLQFPAHEKRDGAFARSKEPENCLSCHRAQPQVQRVKEAEKAHDVLVIGAGVAGLSAAWMLRDLDVLVLEKEPAAGGKLRRRQWEGIWYSEGPAYFVDYDGDVKKLLDEIDLKAIPIPETTNAVMIDGKLYSNPWTTGIDSLPYDKEARERLKKGFREIQSLIAEIAVPARDSSPRLVELDQRKSMEYFEQYGPEMVRIMRPYIRSCFGIEPDDVSALGALNFFAAEFGATYSFPGGLAAISDRLAEKLGDKVRYECFVNEVAPTKDGVRVVYHDKEGKPHAVRAKAAIVTISQPTARYIVKGLSDERIDLMSRVYHGAYVVGAVKTKSVIHDGVYDTWFLEENARVTDVIVADWVARGGKAADSKAKGVITAYMPLGTEGRSKFFHTSLDKLKQELLGELFPRFPRLKDELVEAEVFVYGHGQHVPLQGYLTEVAPKLAEPVEGKIFWAGVELDLPALESAIWSSVEATRAARAALKGEAPPGKDGDGSKPPEKEN